jgi:hypothetical protein
MEKTMTVIKVYDPAQCCSTGVCGPDADDTIAQFASALERARKSGVEVDRFTLGHQPAEYVQNPAVKSLLDSEGIDCLPIVFVGDAIVSKGDYPSRTELLEKAGVRDDGLIEAASCCANVEKAATNCC